jgi:hypothetical protein
MEIVESDVNGVYQGDPWVFVREYESRIVTMTLTSKHGFNSPVYISIKMSRYQNGSEYQTYTNPQELPQDLRVTFDPNPVRVPVNGEVEFHFNVIACVDAQHRYGPSWSLKITGESDQAQTSIFLRLSTKPS